ncbi:hypothetical protein F8388_003062 [Cannabis sativa]|uniref:RNase H type-1 domain-containing protein n=1 Tax=Cannabis sativa TaxID=3483 RepID=A0A7J6HBN2_CANSA|nr:hypothetical protein F8388_003062 [Cannabis sativa]
MKSQKTKINILNKRPQLAIIHLSLGEVSSGVLSFLKQGSLGKSALADYVSSFLQDYQEAQIHSTVSTTSRSPSPAAPDQILTPSTTALFVDAALSQNASATGLGMVFVQGVSHIHQFASINKSGASSPIFAEAQALAEGIQWCLSSNLKPDYIFSDCLNLVSKVKGNWHDHSPLSSLVHQIRTFLSRFPEASLLHISRQHNDKAHSLAKQALRSRDED